MLMTTMTMICFLFVYGFRVCDGPDKKCIVLESVTIMKMIAKMIRWWSSSS
jgi:hypothetical protein